MWISNRVQWNARHVKRAEVRSVPGARAPVFSSSVTPCFVKCLRETPNALYVRDRCVHSLLQGNTENSTVEEDSPESWNCWFCFLLVMVLACIVVWLKLAGIWCCREQFLVKAVEVQAFAHDGLGHLPKITWTGICVDLKDANNLEHGDMRCCTGSLHLNPWTHKNSLNWLSRWRTPPFSNRTSYVTERSFEYWNVQTIWQPWTYSKKGLVSTFTSELIDDFGSTAPWYGSGLLVALIRTDRSLEALDWEGRPCGECHFWLRHWLRKESDCASSLILCTILSQFLNWKLVSKSTICVTRLLNSVWSWYKKVVELYGCEEFAALATGVYQSQEMLQDAVSCFANQLSYLSWTLRFRLFAIQVRLRSSTNNWRDHDDSGEQKKSSVMKSPDTQDLTVRSRVPIGIPLTPIFDALTLILHLAKGTTMKYDWDCKIAMISSILVWSQEANHWHSFKSVLLVFIHYGQGFPCQIS